MAGQLTDAIDAPALSTFREAFAGKVTLPDDPRYDAARVVWNGMIDRRPAIVVRLPSLALRATTIASLTIGLGLLARDLRRACEARLVAALGAALTVVGLVTLFPMIPVGLGLVAIGLIGARYPRAATGSLLVGSMGMVILYVALYQQHAGRVFGEGAPPFQLGPELIFQAAVILIAAGLAAIGFQLRRREV